MNVLKTISFALLTASSLLAGPAFANMCQTDRSTCQTGMPEGGYCECSSHGISEGGTVVRAPMVHRAQRASVTACMKDPQGQGCR